MGAGEKYNSYIPFSHHPSEKLTRHPRKVNHLNYAYMEHCSYNYVHVNMKSNNSHATKSS